MTDSPALLPRLAHVSVTGVKLLAVGLAALALAIVATVTTAVGVATKVLAEVLAQLAGFVREALPALLSIVPVTGTGFWYIERKGETMLEFMLGNLSGLLLSVLAALVIIGAIVLILGSGGRHV